MPKFSGPSNAEKIIDVEMAAVITLLGLLDQTDMKVSSVLVLIDCKELIGLVQENLIVQNLLRALKYKGWIIKFKRLARAFNFEADGLAKLGASQKQLRAYWTV